MARKNPVTIDHADGAPVAPPPKRYRAKLTNLAEVRAEMARVYREARSSVISTTDATKFIWCLDRIANAIEGGVLEKRVEALEDAQGAQAGGLEPEPHEIEKQAILEAWEAAEAREEGSTAQ
jgi:hypothetical protein